MSVCSNRRVSVPKEVMTGNNDAVGRLGRNNRLSLIGSLVSAALGFVVVFVVTRGLGTQGAGIVFVAAGVFNIAMQSAVLGTDAGLVRFIAQARTSNNESTIAALLKAAVVPVVVIGVALGILVAVLAEPIGGLFTGEGELDADVPSAIRVVAVIFPIGAIAMALLAATRGFGQLRTTALADQIARPVIQLIAVAAVVIAGAGPVWATAAWVGPIIVSAVASATWLRGAVPAQSEPGSNAERAITSEFWSFSRPQAGTGMLRVVVRWLGTLVVGALLSLGAAAIFTAATRLLKLGNFVNQATFQAAAPQIAEDLGTGEVEQASAVYRSSSTWLVLATWPLYLGTLFYAPEILGLFGADFVEGASALRILAAAMLVASASGPIEAVLVMSGRTTQNLINNVIALGVNIGLLFVLVPPFGLEGAAIAWAVSVLCTNLLPMSQVVRSLGMHPFGLTHLMTMAAIAVGFAITALITRALGLADIPTLLVGIGLAAVPVILFAWWQRDALALDRLLRPGSKAKGEPVSTGVSTGDEE